MPFMMNKIKVFSLMVTCATAIPTPQTGLGVFPLPDCDSTYTITDQHTVEGDFVTGDYTVGGGGTLNAGSTFSVGITVTVGSDISISKIVGLGLSASVSQTTTKSTSQGAGAPCPAGPWKCALAIYPELLEVSGKEIPSGNSECYTDGNPPPDQPYTARMPIQGVSGGTKSRVEVCACKNFAHWADNGAPSIVCDGCA